MDRQVIIFLMFVLVSNVCINLPSADFPSDRESIYLVLFSQKKMQIQQERVWFSVVIFTNKIELVSSTNILKHTVSIEDMDQLTDLNPSINKLDLDPLSQCWILHSTELLLCF